MYVFESFSTTHDKEHKKKEKEKLKNKLNEMGAQNMT